MTRPADGRGTLGRKIQLETNYFRLKIGRKEGADSILVVQRYQVELVDGRRKLQRLDFDFV